jgi:hypothetical protein
MARTSEPKGSSGVGAVSLKVTLRYTQPPIWRRLLMPATMTLGDLHAAIQTAMGWEDSHLHAFWVDGRQYGRRGSLDDAADESRLTLDRLVKTGIDRFSYTYDFGDDWEHLIVIEKGTPSEPVTYPICVAGKRKCPPDDCGGVPGYERLLEILDDPSHPDYAESVEWVDEGFDPEEFDIKAANALLAARFRRK